MPIKLSLVTGSTQVEVDMTLKRLDSEGIFDSIITADDIVYGKPNPEGYLKAIANMEYVPSTCVGIEDSPSGITAVKAAGIYCIALATTHSPDELSVADIIVNKLDISLFE